MQLTQPLTILFALFALLPLLTITTPTTTPTKRSLKFRPVGLELCPKDRDIIKHPFESDKPLRHGLRGDQLTVTRCYCEAPTYDRWGYYLEANYTNYHNGQSYRAHYLCSDDARGRQYHIPKCWEAQEREGSVICDRDAENNEFCFLIAYAHNTNPLAEDFMIPADVFNYNAQYRDVPRRPNYRVAPDICANHCSMWLDGMLPARNGGSDDWYKTTDLSRKLHPKVCSHQETYTDLDDMCLRCRKKEEV